MLEERSGKASVSEGKTRKYKLTMGERLKDARVDFNKHKKQTIKEVSDATGIPQSTLSEIENDKREPGAGIIRKLAEHYGVSSDFLLGLSDIRTDDITAQSVIEYTGLSEDNVKTLHCMAAAAGGPIIAEEDENVTVIDCNKPFLDCLNDLLDALYYDRDVISNHYVRLRRSTLKNDAVDLWYVMGADETKMRGLQPCKYRDMKLQLKYDNELVEYDCMKIAEKIEKWFMMKYIATSNEIEDLKADIDSVYGNHA